MSLLENEAVAAPEVAAPEVAAPEVAAPEVTAPAKSNIECTKDTRGEAPCARPVCESCN